MKFNHNLVSKKWYFDNLHDCKYAKVYAKDEL